MEGEMETLEEFSERMVEELRVEIQAQVLLCMLIALNEHKKGSMTEEEVRFGGVILISGNSLAGAKYREVSGQSFDMDGYVLFPVFASNLETVIQRLYGKGEVVFPEISTESVNVFIFYRGGLMVKNIRYLEPETESEEFKKLTHLIGSKIASMQEGGELNSILQKLSQEKK